MHAPKGRQPNPEDYCKKPNHFKSVCNKLKRKQQVKLLSGVKPEETDSDDSDDYCYTIKTEAEGKPTISDKTVLDSCFSTYK